MALDRRSFLSSVAAGAAALVAAPTACAAERSGSVAASGPLLGPHGGVDWERVRAEFELDPDWLHFGSFFLVSHPRAVRAAIERWRRELDANPLALEHLLFDPSNPDGPLTAAKRALARYLGGRPEEIALTPNTTTGLALVYHGLVIGPGEEILTTEHDHYVHHESIRFAAEKSGAGVRHVALHDGAAGAGVDEIVARLRRAVRPETRALGVTWVHSSSGLKLPIPAIAAMLAEVNGGRAPRERCLLVVDGVHGFGVEDVDAATMGADFFVAGTHKWLFGPRGTGLVWGRAEAWPRVRPTIPSFDISDEMWTAWVERVPLPPTRANFVAPGGFVAYEHQFAVADAVAFHESLGRARVAARLAELNGKVRRGLAAIPGVTVHTPLDPALAAGITCFEVAGLAPEAVVARLAERRIHATTSPYAVSYARLAAGIMNRPEEIDAALAAVAALARAA